MGYKIKEIAMQNLKISIIFACVSVSSLIHGVFGRSAEQAPIEITDLEEKICTYVPEEGFKIEETTLTEKCSVGCFGESKPIALELALSLSDGKQIGQFNANAFNWQKDKS